MVRAFQLATANSEFSSALYYHQQLKQFDEDNELVEQLQPYVEQINTLIVSPEPIFIVAKVNERLHWHHYLARKHFTLADIEGELTMVDIRCDNHFSTHKIARQQEWEIPKTWGKGQIFVKGEAGATFNLVELGSASA